MTGLRSLKASWLLIGASALALGAALPLFPANVTSARQAARDQTLPATFRAEANYVRVDVYPTTRDEAPVADLMQSDFEVLDNGTPQKIEQFEHIVIRAAGARPQETRVEPNTVRESRAMAETARGRLFVLFLDTYHVDVAGSRAIQKPLIDALNRMIAEDDLVGVMTPEMSANDVTFARKTTTIEGFLTRYWHWGERDRLNPPDPEDEQYGLCYPNGPPGSPCVDQNGIAAEMIDRRHEKRSLDALHDLVVMLRGVREERKAIVAITAGWLLYRPSDALARPLACHRDTAGIPTVTVDPRSGRLTTSDPTSATPETKCYTDRMNLARIDNDRDFRELLDEANRANASFYPVDPRGLAVFDTPIMRTDVPGPPPPVTPPAIDRAMLAGRLNSLRTLAEATDGMAIVNSNNLAAGFKRVADDLSSYYLLGYYATGKLDGKFHSITVRVKRAGVRVRARRGYLAASEADALRAVARANAAPSPTPAAAAEARAIEAAVAPLEGFTRQLPVRVQAAAGWKPNRTAAVWLVGELGMGLEWKAGANADLMLMDTGGLTLATARVRVEPGSRSFRAVLAPTELTSGDYMVRVRLTSPDAIASANDTLRIAVPGAPDAAGALFVHRGPSTANRDVSTSDPRFRRGDQIRVEVPTPADAPVTAQLLDRTGKPLNVPVTASIRDDADGSRWQVAQVALAPLAPSDYVIELSSGGKRTLIGFRVIP
jgi:VWFA-related protein